MVPPINVLLKIGYQLIGRREDISAFVTAEMPVIAFSCLVATISGTTWMTQSISSSVVQPVGRNNRRALRRMGRTYGAIRLAPIAPYAYCITFYYLDSDSPSSRRKCRWLPLPGADIQESRGPCRRLFSAQCAKPS
jgi:hypothetical protein